ncbi:hypothetical protein E2562_018488 [Oryza meyeriana var. granulata]|uniref:Uncharacterized protein n=1 Tax=Oryza meyeriana var. granulata TaxID=110450 RepID=A0A6G1EMJ6_9ORYZ|nr:hypothetical protein E2562_018488 [Oryza meyeriana var. granulata]
MTHFVIREQGRRGWTGAAWAHGGQEVEVGKVHDTTTCGRCPTRPDTTQRWHGAWLQLGMAFRSGARRAAAWLAWVAAWRSAWEEQAGAHGELGAMAARLSLLGLGRRALARAATRRGWLNGALDGRARCEVAGADAAGQRILAGSWR